MDSSKKYSLRQAIIGWVRDTQGWFSYPQMDKELDIGSSEGKTERRVVMKELCDTLVVERDPKKNGIFRLLDSIAPIIQWQDADPSNVLDLRWPFDLEAWVSIYPKNIAIIAGAPNAGKTAFCFDFIRRNMHRAELADLLPIQYFTSEMGAEEMKVRLSKFDTSDWAMVARERSSNFADIIEPNKINVIDYLEVTDNFYLIASELFAIFNKLDKGIALIALQKGRGKELGRGAEFSLEKPRLYLSMDAGTLKIIKGKNWAREGVNPNGQKWTFSLVQGAKFVDIKEAQ